MSKHVVIIGGGIIGLSAALYAARRGHRVTVVDRRESSYLGTSFGNAGFVSPSHFTPLAAPGTVKAALKWMLSPESPFYVKPRLDRDLIAWGWKFLRASTVEQVAKSAPLLGKMLVESHRDFEKLAAEWNNDFDFVQRGILMVCNTEKALAHEAALAARGRDVGVPGEVVDPKRLAELEPGVKMNVAGAVLYPQDSHLSPNLFMKSIRERLPGEGVELRWNTEVRGWRMKDGTIAAVETNRGDIAGDEFVICGGAWSPRLARDLGLSLPLQAGKGYSLTIPRPSQKPSRPMILMEARVAVSPLGDALRIGGTMEIAGLEERVNPARIRGIMKSLPKYFAEFPMSDFDGVEPWYGFRPVSPDGMPYIGRFAKYRNLSAATGHAMIGVSLAPITGKLISEVLDGEPPSIPLDQLSPDRFA
jgi:D-amino-acid dehydrogenase